YLDEDAIGDAALDTLLQPAGVGDKEVVADKLDALSQLARQPLPAVPVVLGQAVLDRADPPAMAVFLPEVPHLVARGEVIGIALEEAVAMLAAFLRFLEQFGGRRVESEDNLIA